MNDALMGLGVVAWGYFTLVGVIWTINRLAGFK